MFYFKLDELNKPIVEEGIFKFGKPTKHLVVPNGVTRVLGLKTKRDLEERKYGWDIFYGSYYQNDFLESLVLPSSVKVIGEKAFEHAHALKEVKLNEGLEEIRLSAFLGDNNLKLVDIPNTVKTINDWGKVDFPRGNTEFCDIRQPLFIRPVCVELAVQDVFRNVLRIGCIPRAPVARILYGGSYISASANAQRSLVIDFRAVVFFQIIPDSSVSLIRTFCMDLFHQISDALVFLGHLSLLFFHIGVGFFKGDAFFLGVQFHLFCLFCQDDDIGTPVTFALNADQQFLLLQSVNQLGDGVGISVEPCRRDTFPAIALATNYLVDILGKDPEETVVVCPVDPYVEDDYYVVLKELSELVEKEDAGIVLMGIEPTSAADKFGYILPETKDQVSKVKTFKENPDEASAKKYIEQGALWNSGVFAFKIKYMLEMLHKLFDYEDYHDLLNKLFELCDSLLICKFDYYFIQMLIFIFMEYFTIS